MDGDGRHVDDCMQLLNKEGVAVRDLSYREGADRYVRRADGWIEPPRLTLTKDAARILPDAEFALVKALSELSEITLESLETTCSVPLPFVSNILFTSVFVEESFESHE